MTEREEPPAQQPYLRIPWLIAFLFLVILTLVTVSYPLIRTFAHIQINYNEGWNAYRAQMAQRGVPLYGAEPTNVVTNYPPLSFHFVGFVGRITGDVVVAGRYISLVSLLVIGIFIAAIVRRFTSRGQAGTYAALSFLVWLAIFQPDRIGMNDPQLFATTFGLLGLYLYVSRPDSNRWLCLSAVAFAVCVFAKHNLLAFPMAVGAHMLFTGSFKRGSFKHWTVWAGVLAAAGIALLLITLRVDGTHFLAHLTAPRPYSIDEMLPKIGKYLQIFQLPLAAAVVWSLWNFANFSRNLLALALLAAHAIAFGFSGGYGVDGNIFFDCIIVLAMITGIALSDVAEVVQTRRLGGIILTVMLLAPLSGVIPLLPDRIARDYQDARAIPRMEDEFEQAVAFLSAHPGPAFCNDLLLCFDAGKTEEVDTFQLASRIGTGIVPDDEAVKTIEAHHYSTIEVESSDQGLIVPGWPLKNLMGTVIQNYNLALKTTRFGILIPKD